MTETSTVGIAKGLEGIVVEKTALSHVDGKNGILIYRGYNIDELAQCSFEEIVHLFFYGDLPTRQQLNMLDEQLRNERTLPAPLVDWILSSPKTDHPMATLRTAVSMLSGYLPQVDVTDVKGLKAQAIALVAKTTTIAACIMRAFEGKAPIEPDMSLSHAANFLKMTRGKEVDDVLSRTLDTALILHVDHGFNASTFTARVVCSTLSDMISSVSAAVGSLKGPLHGGANAAVMEMLQEIGTIDQVEPWLNKALEEKKKIMGFGHRVYRTKDPRAKHLKQMSKEWGERSHEMKWFQMSEKLEELMMEKKGINANVDFYSASTYFAMGIQPKMYTVLFAMARMLGWCAHVIEQLSDNRLMRPKAAYIGPMDKKFVPIDQRG